MQKPNFLEDEVVLYESAPLPAVKAYMAVSATLTFVIFISFIFLPMTFVLTDEFGFGAFFGMTILYLILITVIFSLSLLIASKSYTQRYYWITNRRVIYRRGTFGYVISSLPLERISDVIISRTFWENAFGFGSIQIQTLAGQISAAAAGSEGYLQAIPEPEKVQQILLTEMKNSRARI